MTLTDLKQPANQWLADVVENLGQLLEQGDDPEMQLELFGQKFTIRLDELSDGSFVRKSAELISTGDK
jgi:hypothetical protein